MASANSTCVVPVCCHVLCLYKLQLDPTAPRRILARVPFSPVNAAKKQNWCFFDRGVMKIHEILVEGGKVLCSCFSNHIAGILGRLQRWCPHGWLQVNVLLLVYMLCREVGMWHPLWWMTCRSGKAALPVSSFSAYVSRIVLSTLHPPPVKLIHGWATLFYTPG